MLLIWQDFNAKMFILFAIYLGGVEVFVQIRWRMSVNCPYCGFDPVLYRKDRKALVKKVKLKLELAKRRPGLMLSKHNPFLNLPTRSGNELRPSKSKELPSS